MLVNPQVFQYKIDSQNIGNINQPELKSTNHPFRKSVDNNKFLDTFYHIKNKIKNNLIYDGSNVNKATLRGYNVIDNENNLDVSNLVDVVLNNSQVLFNKVPINDNNESGSYALTNNIDIQNEVNEYSWSKIL